MKTINAGDARYLKDGRLDAGLILEDILAYPDADVVIEVEGGLSDAEAAHFQSIVGRAKAFARLNPTRLASGKGD